MDVNLKGELKVALEGVPESAKPDPPSSQDPADPDKDAKENRVAVATTLATGVTVLVSALGLFGGLTGAVARMARNYPEWSAVAFGAVILSVALAITARLAAAGEGGRTVKLPRSEQQPHWSTFLLGSGISLFLLGLLLAIGLLTLTIDKDDRPAVAAQSTRSDSGITSLAGTAKAGGLAAEDAVRVVVVSRAEGQTGKGRQIYYAVVGPNPDGVVDHSFTVILPDKARSAVITVRKDAAGDSPTTPACQPKQDIAQPVDSKKPVVVPTEERELTACLLVAVPPG